VSFVGYVLCECPEHGTVCAKHLSEQEGGPGDALHFYACPGVEGDTGGCNHALKPLGQGCDRPAWAEYPDEHVSEL
jgi:hypothetical protein